jgi:hypothetical protein
MSLLLLHQRAKLLFNPLIGLPLDKSRILRLEETKPVLPAPVVKKKVPVVTVEPEPENVLKYTLLGPDFAKTGTTLDLPLKKPITLPDDLPAVYLDYTAHVIALDKGITTAKPTRADMMKIAQGSDNIKVRQFTDVNMIRIKRCIRIISEAMV